MLELELRWYEIDFDSASWPLYAALHRALSNMSRLNRPEQRILSIQTPPPLELCLHKVANQPQDALFEPIKRMTTQVIEDPLISTGP